MTEKEIASIIGKVQVLAGNLVCENVTGIVMGDADLLSLGKGGYLSEFEIKISKADFRKDAKKSKRAYFEPVPVPSMIPNYFWYVVEGFHLNPEDVPQWAGLIVILNQEPHYYKTAPLIHRHKHDQTRILTKFTRLHGERRMLGCAKMTYLNKQFTSRCAYVTPSSFGI